MEAARKEKVSSQFLGQMIGEGGKETTHLWKSSCKKRRVRSKVSRRRRGLETRTRLETYLRQDTRPKERNHRDDSNHSHIPDPALKLLLDTPESNREHGDAENEPVGSSELVSVRFDGRDDEFVIPAVAEVEEGPNLRGEERSAREERV